jgi:hypothetical protein
LYVARTLNELTYKDLRQKIAQALWEEDRRPDPDPYLPKLGLGMQINTAHYGRLADLALKSIGVTPEE